MNRRVIKISRLCFSPFDKLRANGFTQLSLNIARSVWRAIRELSGDDGYERYLAHHATAHPDVQPLTRAAWFTHNQHEKWTGVKRCC